MRRTLRVGLVLASLAAGVVACTSAPPATPPPTLETPAWDPRKDAIDQAAAIWQRHDPGTYAYTVSNDGTSVENPGWRYRVSSLDGGDQAQLLFAQSGLAGALPTDELSVEGLFARARGALASDAFRFDYDRRLGNPTSLAFADSTVRVDGFTTAGDTGSANRARTALGELLERRHDLGDRAWEYTWTRIPAGAPGATPETWTVHHDRKGTTTRKTVDGGLAVTSDDVSLDGTALAITTVLGSGGWADVAIEDRPGFGVLIAVDPSPSARGDAYWIRIAWTDLAQRASMSELESAKARWATSQLTDYSYVWRFDGDRDLVYNVTRKGEAATVKPQGDTPVVEGSFVAPRVEDTFELIEQVLAQGGTVDATYDETLGYPVRVVMDPAGDAGAKGVITIRNLKRR